MESVFMCDSVASCFVSAVSALAVAEGTELVQAGSRVNNTQKHRFTCA